ncbi:MAG: ABC transporter permease [Vicinamibacterales bacterium]
MHLAQDIRLAIRRIRRTPLFAVTVAGTLALGVAAATSIYSVVDGVLLKPLPFPRSDTLVKITADFKGIDLRNVGLSQPELEDFGKRSGALESIAGIWPITANLTGSERPERVEVLLTSSNYFDLLGARAALGRTYNERDEIPGIATAAVISDGLWRRGFGSDPRIVGRTLRIDEDLYEVIGVMPESFRHPSVTLETDVEVWAASGWKAAPFPAPGHSVRFMPSAIGRMAPGVTLEVARARVDNLARELVREHPDDYPARLGWTPQVQSLAADLVAGVRPALLMLMGGVVLVLLIAISNISNLLLVRAVEREREVAIQRALGATRVRIIAGLLVEGVVLAAIGGALGLLISVWGVDLLLTFVPERLPRATEIGIDRRVFLFTAITSMLAGLLVALAPALQSARADVIGRLKAAGRTVPGGARARVRNALVIAQIAIAIVLLANAALLVRSLWNLQDVETGIAKDRLLTARVWLPQPNDPSAGPYFTHEKRVAVIRGLVERLQALPDVAFAGVSTALPAFNDSGTASFAVEGWTPDRRDLATATPVAVTPEYFRALGITLIAGRFLNDSDNEHTGRSVVINQTLARTYFGSEDPIGRRFRFVGRRGQVAPNAPWVTIVGVGADVKEDGLDLPVRPQIYQSLWQISGLALAIVAQGRSAPPSVGLVRKAVADVDPNLPLYALRTGDELVASQLAQRRFATHLLEAFALAALGLAAFGLHGVIAYGVRQRTHEIGVRVALGATASRVIGLVLHQAARVMIVGMVIGLGAALLASRLMTTMLFGVRASDPLTLVVVVVLLAAVVGVATFGAARRAARIDPAVALRLE